MTRLSSFQDVNKKLAQFVTGKEKTTYSLNRIYQVMSFLGNPQDKLKVIHVAGTSGKTSTCYYIAALLRSLGKTVGLTVSPHVAEVNERLQINLIPLPELEFCQELESFFNIIKPANIKLSYFELLIAFAYWEFAKLKVDYAVVEVGVGGLLDGTNIVSRADKVCVITDIGLDHVKILGSTIKAIAKQKAGIIQSGNTVFAYRQDNDVVQAIMQRCKQQDAKLFLIEQGAQTLIKELPLFQQRNFELSKSVVEYVVKRDNINPLKDQQIVESSKAHIPGRMEIIKYQNKVIVLDGAHNPQKLQALANSIRAQFPNQAIAALISFSAANADSRLNDGLAEIIKLVEFIIATTFMVTEDMHQQSVDPEEILKACLTMGFRSIEVEVDSAEAFTALLNRSEPILLITGSLYLLSQVRPLVLQL